MLQLRVTTSSELADQIVGRLAEEPAVTGRPVALGASLVSTIGTFRAGERWSSLR